MKKIFLLAGLFTLVYCGNAQKLITKNFSYSGKESIKLDLNIADSIRITTWNKNEVSLKCLVNINNNTYNDDYRVNFSESGNMIEVRAKFETDHKMIWNSDSNCCSYRSEIIWEVFVPENAPFSIETINGDIIIDGKTDEIKAYTISGYIDLSVSNNRKADFKLSTITGTVYSNILSSNSSDKHNSSNNIFNRFNGGGKSVTLKTISGDIYLRKAE